MVPGIVDFKINNFQTIPLVLLQNHCKFTAMSNLQVVADTPLSRTLTFVKFMNSFHPNDEC